MSETKSVFSGVYTILKEIKDFFHTPSHMYRYTNHLQCVNMLFYFIFLCYVIFFQATLGWWRGRIRTVKERNSCSAFKNKSRIFGGVLEDSCLNFR